MGSIGHPSQAPKDPRGTHRVPSGPSLTAKAHGIPPVKEASISTDTLALAVPRLSTMICSHFSQGGESRARLQLMLPVQVRLLWKDWGRVMEPSSTLTAQALCSLVTQLLSWNCIPAACLGTKTLQGEGTAVCRVCTPNTSQAPRAL